MSDILNKVMDDINSVVTTCPIGSALIEAYIDRALVIARHEGVLEGIDKLAAANRADLINRVVVED